ncbi:hypothetical protein IFM89_034434 [Coptis chinensis]|uniref:Uncharacterized protein n=1 Tax=Coptis chinensis TaxID=261450 RepID=A0A835MBI1_9MAGN|nr:hypothetical protein IFM89_034434 [Coptis chinensis]
MCSLNEFQESSQRFLRADNYITILILLIVEVIDRLWWRALMQDEKAKAS